MEFSAGHISTRSIPPRLPCQLALQWRVISPRNRIYIIKTPDSTCRSIIRGMYTRDSSIKHWIRIVYFKPDIIQFQSSLLENCLLCILHYTGEKTHDHHETSARVWYVKMYQYIKFLLCIIPSLCWKQIRFESCEQDMDLLDNSIFNEDICVKCLVTIHNLSPSWSTGGSGHSVTQQNKPMLVLQAIINL